MQASNCDEKQFQQNINIDTYYLNTDEDKFNAEADTRNFFNFTEFNNNKDNATKITDNTETTIRSTENNTTFNTPDMAAYFNTYENILNQNEIYQQNNNTNFFPQL